MFSSIPMISWAPGKGLLFCVGEWSLDFHGSKCSWEWLGRFCETSWHGSSDFRVIRGISLMAGCGQQNRHTTFLPVSAFPISRPVAPLGNGNGKPDCMSQLGIEKLNC